MFLIQVIVLLLELVLPYIVEVVEGSVLLGGVVGTAHPLIVDLFQLQLRLF